MNWIGRLPFVHSHLHHEVAMQNRKFCIFIHSLFRINESSMFRSLPSLNKYKVYIAIYSYAHTLSTFPTLSCTISLSWLYFQTNNSHINYSHYFTTNITPSSLTLTILFHYSPTLLHPSFLRSFFILLLLY